MFSFGSQVSSNLLDYLLSKVLLLPRPEIFAQPVVVFSGRDQLKLSQCLTRMKKPFSLKLVLVKPLR